MRSVIVYEECDGMRSVIVLYEECDNMRNVMV